MKVSDIVVAAAVLIIAASGASQAQTPPAQQAPPAQKPVAQPAQQAPPAQKPAAQPAPAPAPPPKPFPVGAKFAVVDLQRIAVESAEGKSAAARINSLNQKKVAELNDKNKALQTAQQKLAAGALLTDAAKAQIQKEIDRLNLDIQRFTQDAQAEVQELSQQVQMDFQRKLMPIIELVAIDKGVQIVFTNDAGLVWADEALDLTPEVIRRFDGAMGAPAPPKPPSID
jgi:Skp family chaperone for outer membrane proteins